MKLTKSLSLVLALVLIFSLVACNTNTLSALARIVSNSLGTLAVIDPANAGAYSKASGIMLKVSDEIAAWKPGTPAQEITQGVTDVVSILETVVAPNQQILLLIGLAESTLEEIIQLVQPKGADAHIEAKAKRTMTGPPPKTAAEYKVAWNNIAPAGAQLK